LKRIGLLGGMSWESSVEYERIINTEVRARLGGTNSADLVIRSYNFADIERLQAEDRWEDAGALLAADARALESAGAQLILLCTNTMHAVAPAIETAITVPFLHLADTTAEAVLGRGLQTVALLGTRYTMEAAFYRDRLLAAGLSVVVPDSEERDTVHRVIYEELVRGIVKPESKSAYLRIIEDLVSRGAEGVIAGCTEIELLVTADDVTVPFFPTTRLHALAAVDLALG
jgi:aspartate racemase